MQKCRIDGSELIPIMDFGNIYFSDFVDDATDGFKSPLKIGMCEKCGLIQLFDAPDPEKMYRKYWYRSGINESMILALEDIQRQLWQYVNLEEDDIILDIGANDGTFLGKYNYVKFLGQTEGGILISNKYTRIGIDPAQNLKEYYKDKCEYYIEDFFTAENYWSVAKKKAKIIASIAMFYDLPDPDKFIQDVKECLDKEGIWVIQMSYTPLMLEQNAFDNICHEHIEYYTLTVLNNLLEKNGFKIIDIELNNVNSGSIRAYVMYDNEWPKKFTEHDKIIGKFRVQSLLEYEKKLQLDTAAPYLRFVAHVNDQRDNTMALLQDLKQQKKLVIGYGASTKGNTLLQYYGITRDLIPYIAERTKEKWGKFTIGTGIKIISEEEMRFRKPEYLFIFPWHFVNQFQEREKDLIKNGTKFIVPLPTLKIV